jgi:hypothetical protein
MDDNTQHTGSKRPPVHERYAGRLRSTTGANDGPTDEPATDEPATDEPATDDGHGGARPGAGRPPVRDRPLEKHTYSIPEGYHERLADHGDGNASRGLRRILDVVLNQGRLPLDVEPEQTGDSESSGL